MRGFIKKLALTLAILTSVCVILLIGTFFLFHSPVMQKAMEKSLHKYILNKTDGRVQIEGLHLAFPSDVRIDFVKILDNESAIAEIKDLDIDISLWLLPFSELSISNLSVNSIAWMSSTSTESNSKSSLDEKLQNLNWPSLPIGIKIENYFIKELKVPGIESSFALKGSLQSKKLGGDIKIHTHLLSEQFGKAELHGLGKARSEHIYLKLSYDPSAVCSKEIRDLHLRAKTSFRLKDLKNLSIQPQDIFALSLEGDGIVDINQEPTKFSLSSKASMGSSGFIKLDRCYVSSPLASLNIYGSIGPKALQGNPPKNIFKLYESHAPLSIDCMFSVSPNQANDYLTNPLTGSFKGEYGNNLSGALLLDTLYKSIPIEGSSLITWNKESQLEFKDISVESRESLLSGNLLWNISNNDLLGHVDGSLLHFPFSAVTDFPFQGDTDFKVDFEQEDNLQFEFMLQNVSSDYARAFKGKVQGSLTNYLHIPLLALDAKLSNVFIKDVGAKDVELHLDSNDVSSTFSARAQGLENTPFDISIGGTVDRKGEFLTLDMIHGDLYDLPLTSTQAVTLKREHDLIEMTPIQLFLGQGECLISGSFSKTKGVMWDCKLFHLPLKPLQYLKSFDFIEGVISGTSKATLSTDQVEGDCNFKISQLLFHPEMQLEETPLEGSLVGSIDSSHLELEGEFSGVGAVPSKCSIKLPLKDSKSPLGVEIAKDSSLSGSLSAQGIIQPISKLILSEQDLLAGHWKGDFNLSGTWNSPQLTGSGVFKNGYYENLATGLSLKDINFNISAQNHIFRLENGVAECGKKGKISFTGAIDSSKESLLDFSLNLNNTPILDIQDGSATASGKLFLKGSFEEPVISGAISLNQMELLIPDEVSDPLPTIQVEYVYPQPQPIEKAQTTTIPLSLDVNIDIGNNSFVRGRGLNSKWNGNLKVSGKVEQPKIFGSFQLVRGEFAFSSANFNLTEGKILFDDDTSNLGFLSITGESKAQDVNIYVGLKGPLQSPVLSFSSSPSYPETEILSLILFGSTSQDITPLQALQVTQAVVQLSKGYSNLDVINLIRQNVGLDQLSITSMDEDPSNLEVHVGKYLSQNIYLALAKSLSANTNLISASLELFNSFSLSIEHIEMYETQIVKDRLQAGWKHSY